MAQKFDILYLIDSGIGNALEAFYAIEYCIAAGAKTGIFLNKINQSFQNYIKDCYGNDVVISSLENVSCKYLVHSFTYQEKFEVEYEHYFYVNPDVFSSPIKSETEQYLGIAKALFPCGFQSDILQKLRPQETDLTKSLNLENKTIFYPGSSPEFSLKRWQNFKKLEKIIGKENVLWVGGKDDYFFEHSYIYTEFQTKIFPQKIMNSRFIWNSLKKIGALKKHAHYPNVEKQENSFFNKFSWEELVEVFQKCKNFVGNDGGLTHLAAASGVKGVVLFGATSVEKNKPYNSDMKVIRKNYSCQPCQFCANGINMTSYFNSCPYQIKCMRDISAEEVSKYLEL